MWAMKPPSSANCLPQSFQRQVAISLGSSGTAEGSLAEAERLRFRSCSEDGPGTGSSPASDEADGTGEHGGDEEDSPSE